VAAAARQGDRNTVTALLEEGQRRGLPAAALVCLGRWLHRVPM